MLKVECSIGQEYVYGAGSYIVCGSTRKVSPAPPFHSWTARI
jgi:hypothetical protein